MYASELAGVDLNDCTLLIVMTDSVDVVIVSCRMHCN